VVLKVPWMLGWPVEVFVVDYVLLFGGMGTTAHATPSGATAHVPTAAAFHAVFQNPAASPEVRGWPQQRGGGTTKKQEKTEEKGRVAANSLNQPRCKVNFNDTLGVTVRVLRRQIVRTPDPVVLDREDQHERFARRGGSKEEVVEEAVPEGKVVASAVCGAGGGCVDEFADDSNVACTMHAGMLLCDACYLHALEAEEAAAPAPGAPGAPASAASSSSPANPIQRSVTTMFIKFNWVRHDA
jgi:hypothetical protein